MNLMEMGKRLEALSAGEKRAILTEFEAHLVALSRRSQFKLFVANKEVRVLRTVSGVTEIKEERQLRPVKD